MGGIGGGVEQHYFRDGGDVGDDGCENGWIGGGKIGDTFYYLGHGLKLK